MAANEAMPSTAGSLPMKKEIKKEGLSEYFLYTIQGTETVSTGWSKRLPSFDALEVPVVSLYKFEQQRYGDQTVRFISFKNDIPHKLGETPIPGGVLKSFGWRMKPGISLMKVNPRLNISPLTRMWN